MENQSNRKIFNIKTVGLASLSLLLIMIFLSKTIYNYNLPVVTAALPKKGALNKIEFTSGIVKHDNLNELYSEKGGKVKSVLVREGDPVTKGQSLIEMDFTDALADLDRQLRVNQDDIEKKLNDLKIGREKLQVDIEKITTNISNVNRKIEELKQESYKLERVSDFELTQCRQEIQKAEDELEKMEYLLEAGVATAGEVENARYALAALRSKYENLERVYEESLEKNSDLYTEKEAERQKQLKDYEYQLEAYSQELKSKTLDLTSNGEQERAYTKEFETKKAELHEELDEYKANGTVYATEDSFVLSVEVNEGQYVGEHQPLVTLGIEEYVVDCEVALNNNFVVVGDTCVLNNSSHTLDGLVTKVTPSEQSKRITLSIPAEGVTAGETFDIKFEKSSEETYTLVPNGAVNKDSDGYFLRQVKRREGILGQEFYTEKLRVYIGDSDLENTAIVKGIGFFEPVALLSDKTFEDGDTIKLKNESDFFEN